MNTMTELKLKNLKENVDWFQKSSGLTAFPNIIFTFSFIIIFQISEILKRLQKLIFYWTFLFLTSAMKLLRQLRILNLQSFSSTYYEKHNILKWLTSKSLLIIVANIESLFRSWKADVRFFWINGITALANPIYPHSRCMLWRPCENPHFIDPRCTSNNSIFILITEITQVLPKASCVDIWNFIFLARPIYTFDWLKVSIVPKLNLVFGSIATRHDRIVNEIERVSCQMRPIKWFHAFCQP